MSRARPISRLPLAAFAVGLAVMLAAAPSRADLEEKVFLRYRETGRCPARAAFVAQVEARTARAQWVGSAEGVREFSLTVGQDEAGASGRLVIRTHGGPPAVRTIRGQSCSEVVAAMALVTALAIDPRAKTEPLPAPAEPGAEAPSEPVAPAEPAPPADGARPPPPKPAEAAPEPVRASPPSTSAPEPVSSNGTLRWTVGVHAQAASGLDLGLSFVLPLYVDLLWDREQVLSPSFRLAASFMPRRTVSYSSDEAELTSSAELWRAAGHLSACPVRLELVRTLSVAPCLGLEAGLLYGEGQLEPSAEAGALWLALSADGRLGWTPLEWLVLEVQGQLGVPLVRPRFYFEPDATIASTDPVFGTVGGGLGVRFP